MSAPTTGICQYVSVIPDATPLPWGLVSGGTMRDADAPQHRRGTGGIDHVVGGLVTPGGAVEFLPCATTEPAWIDLIQRDPEGAGYPCYPLPEFDVGYGTEGAELLYTGCKMGSTTLEGAVGDPLKVSSEFMALLVAESVANAPEMATIRAATHFEWNQAVVTLNSLGYQIQGFTAGLENNLTPWTDMDGAEANALRLPKFLLEGDEVVRLDLRTSKRIPYSVRGPLDDNLPIDLAFVATFTSGGQVLTVSIAGLATGTGESPVEAESGVVIYSYGFEAEINSAALSIIQSAVGS